MEKITIALIVAIVAIVIGLILLFSGVGWYVNNSKNDSNPSRTGAWILMAIGAFLTLVGIIALAAYLFWGPSTTTNMTVMMPTDNAMMEKKMMMENEGMAMSMPKQQPMSTKKSFRMQLPDKSNTATSPLLGEALEKSSYVKPSGPSPVM